jgi:ABC-type uncharacterized transport system ATPase subunit
MGVWLEDEYLVEMRGIVKRFPNVLANDNANFTLKKGEVHALLGENGAGKTTLMNVLYGLYRPDAGEIKVYGKRVEIRSPRDAIRLGIGMVHQQFKLIPVHTVAENIILGIREAGIILNTGKINQELSRIIESYGWRISPESRVWQLSAGEKTAGRAVESTLQESQDTDTRRADLCPYAAGGYGAISNAA